MKEVCITTRAAWRRWLTRNHNRESGIWLVFHKKHTGVPSLDYDAVVEEALCFGWIDSIVRRIDEDRYARKLTPRKPDSLWSDLNKQRVHQLTKDRRMTKAGLARVQDAKKSGLWDRSPRPQVSLEIPLELKQALAKHKKAKAFFARLAPSYQQHFCGWIATAKRQDTKERRIRESISLLEQGKKLGLK